MPDVVRDNKTQQRFEMDAGNDTAVAYYQAVAGLLIFTHTEVPAALWGQGIGSRLIRGVTRDGPRQRPQGRAGLLLRRVVYEPASSRATESSSRKRATNCRMPVHIRRDEGAGRHDLEAFARESTRGTPRTSFEPMPWPCRAAGTSVWVTVMKPGD